ncbi:uncharacterized protein EDB91DRAFT_1236361 [Suillus paluster]|uniref:uncharacterized protein n=1 Tax=Suillus paluster TaxID=48578 RepID=UPI001B878568|nr:uncharacterized protein EDB91DRAFT_1236361 [Suillus paluster]KAG1745488.1 hypothetical protein EDB91DRAFT_1236361 [Suillus paluster]
MDIDHAPNIPNIDTELRVNRPGFGDWDEVFQDSSGEGDGQVHGEGTPTHLDFIDWHPEPSQTYGRGYTFLDLFHSDMNSVYRTANHYYPFSGWKDWEVALWLLHSGLSMAKINTFLSLEMIKSLPLSFCSAKELRGRVEMLPSGPPWLSQVIPTVHLTKLPVILYWCDPLDCIAGILNHPFFHNQIDFTPRRSALPRGAMLLGTILSSDKTNISMMMGDRDCLIHECLNIVLHPLMQAAHEGVMLSDPLCVIRTRADPDDIETFFHEAQKFRLNGVSQPFFENWVLSEPSHFFTPETHHHIHQEFYDHDVKWLVCAVGDTELDFRFSVLQPITGFHHFHSGISKLKQVTGCAQHDIQRLIIAVSADAVPSAVITAIRALMDFHYLVQSLWIDDRDLERISAALDEFHANKDAIIAGGFRRGQRGGVIDNWYIPKIELMQSIVPSIRNSGVIMQWTADTTEHAHITEIKDPTRSSNNNDYDSQICHHLDHADKCRRFELTTSLLDNMSGSKQQIHTGHGDAVNDNVDFDVDNDHDIPAELLVIIKCPGHSCPIINYFAIAKLLQAREVGTVPVPLRSFSVGCTSFHLTYEPSIRTISVDAAALKFGLPDLRPAIADFLSCEAAHGQDFVHIIRGARRAVPATSLPFEKLQVWFKLQLQDTDFHDISIIWPAQTLNCSPPSGVWTCGRCSWPTDGLRGTFSSPAILIILIINSQGTLSDRFLTYVYHIDVILQGGSNREPSMQLHMLKRAKRSNGTRVGDIVPVSQFRAPVNLVPRFGASAYNLLTPYNGMEHASEFWLNKYWDKNTFFPLSM